MQQGIGYRELVNHHLAIIDKRKMTASYHNAVIKNGFFRAGDGGDPTGNSC